MAIIPVKGFKTTEETTNLLAKIITAVLISAVIGGFAFLWNMHGDLAAFKERDAEFKRVSQEFRQSIDSKLSEIDSKTTNGFANMNGRLDAFDSRITILEVIIGLKGNGIKNKKPAQ